VSRLLQGNLRHEQARRVVLDDQDVHRTSVRGAHLGDLPVHLPSVANLVMAFLLSRRLFLAASRNPGVATGQERELASRIVLSWSTNLVVSIGFVR
jgi:hypothetical protein